MFLIITFSVRLAGVGLILSFFAISAINELRAQGRTCLFL